MKTKAVVLTKREVMRRLRALIALPVKARPVAITTIEEMAGLSKRQVYEIVGTGAMSERSRIRLERALLWVENNQVRVEKKHGKPKEVTIEEPKPPCFTLQVVRFTEGRPRIQKIAYNPNAFPEDK